jgi:hypothetical protein
MVDHGSASLFGPLTWQGNLKNGVLFFVDPPAVVANATVKHPEQIERRKQAEAIAVTFGSPARLIE